MTRILSRRYADGHCADCALRDPVPPQPKPVVVLMNSVGQGGINLGPDVRSVQSLLNDFSRDQGGPVAPLAVDGICGDKTIAAIKRYQLPRLGYADGRIDPGGPTLACLNFPRINPIGQSRISQQGVFQPTVGQGNDSNLIDFPLILILRDYVALMPTVRAAIMSARRRLSNIGQYVTNQRLTAPAELGLERERKNIELVDDCFGLTRFDDPQPAYRKLVDVYDLMSRAADRCQVNDDTLANGLFAMNPVGNLDELFHEAAYVERCGFHVSPFTESDHPDHPGHLVRSDRIYITRNAFVFMGHRPSMMSLIIHELAHWVSRPHDVIRDIVNGNAYWDDQRFREMPEGQRISNAENYGWFGTRSYFEPYAY